MTRVFLSASFPSGERGDAFRPYRTADIGAAASAVAEAVLRTGADLVFGGHPTISPLVLQIAGLLKAGRQVEIWQSDSYRDVVTPEVHRLVGEEGARLLRVPKGKDRPSSLALLRDRMLAEGAAAAFFVGGMEGIGDEFHLLRQTHPDTPAFLFVTPGGMTARLAQQAAGQDQPVPGMIHELRGRGYGSLALQALRDVGLDVPDRPGEL
jgi:hypothetical protein